MTARPWQRLDWEPFRQEFERQHGTVSVRRVAQVCEVSTVTVSQSRRRGVTHLVADRLATRLDMHVTEIWPDAYEQFNARRSA